MNVIFWITICVLATAVTYDIRFSRIPNWLTFPVMATAIVYHTFTTGVLGFALSVGGLVIGFSVFLVFYVKGGMGAGDVKLMAAMGALLGPRDILFAAAFTAIAGGAYAVILLAFSKRNRKTLARYGAMAKGLALTGHLTYIGEGGKMTPLRYGVAIGAGTLVVLAQRMM